MAENKDLDALTGRLKKMQAEFNKREGARLAASSNPQDRELAANWARAAANDTTTMISTGSGTGRRIGADGRATGPELRRDNAGNYVDKKGKKR